MSRFWLGLTGTAAVLRFAAMATVAVLIPAAAAAQGMAASVNVDFVIEEPLSQTSPVIGRFVSKQSGIVAALMRGPVGDVAVAVGDRVRKGDVLASLVTERIRWSRELAAAELKARQARLRTAKAQLALTQQELARLANLRNSAAFSQARHEDKRNEVAKFLSEVGEREAEISSAAAELRLAEIDLYNAQIRAPYNAIVSEKHVSPGVYLNVGDPVVTLVNGEALEIEANVPAERISGLVPGRSVDIRLDNGMIQKATVRALVPTEHTQTRTRPVRFSQAFDAAFATERALAMNQSVTVLVPLGKPRNVVSVHKDGVIPRGGQNIVFVVEGGKALQREVQLGSAVGNRFEVLEGLRVGDAIVVRGNERLHPGQDVTYEGMPKDETAVASPKP
ncbi:MAG: efflux RND transporter periplasmic adaptor subunit [Alphaproteobacteria bacterium]